MNKLTANLRGRHAEPPKRRSMRLNEYDYAQAGLYFVTICCQNWTCLFGEIMNGEMILNDAGMMIKKWYYELENKFPDIKCNEMVVMPNHLHAIFQIVGATLVVARNDVNTQKYCQKQKNGQPQGIAPTVGNVVGAFKSITTVEYIHGVKNNGWRRFDGKLWQRNYWEHVVRNENEYQRIAQYILDNPAKWEMDQLNNGTGNKRM